MRAIKAAFLFASTLRHTEAVKGERGETLNTSGVIAFTLREAVPLLAGGGWAAAGVAGPPAP